MEKRLQVYLGGDILSAGANLLRDIQRDEINSTTGIKCYSPLDDESINDKANAKQEGLAERILQNDYYAMYNSDVYTFDVENTAVGTVNEIGIILGMKRQAEEVLKRLEKVKEKYGTLNQEDEELYNFNKTLVDRPVFCYCSDLRQGHGKPYLDPDRAEYSINQFLLGSVLALTNGEGLISWEEVKERLAEIGKQ